MDPAVEYPRSSTERIYLDSLIVQSGPPSPTVEYQLKKTAPPSTSGWGPMVYDAVKEKRYFILNPSTAIDEYTVFVRVAIPDTNQLIVLDAGRIRIS